MHPVRKFIEMIRLYRSGRVGDSAVIKFSLFGVRPSEACARAIAEVPTLVPPADMAALRELPEDSFGRAYARFLDEHGISQLEVHPEALAEAGTDAFSLRYMTTHDMVHTLLGCEPDFAGEIAVFAATVEQGSFREGERLLRWSVTAWSVMMPWRRAELKAAAERGRELGRRAKFLLTLPFERLWTRPLAEVRREAGLA